MFTPLALKDEVYLILFRTPLSKVLSIRDKSSNVDLTAYWKECRYPVDTYSRPRSILTLRNITHFSDLRIAWLSLSKVSMWTTASQRWEQGWQFARVVSRLMLMLPFKENVLQLLDKSKYDEAISQIALHLRLRVEDTEGKMAATHLIFLVEVGPG